STLSSRCSPAPLASKPGSSSTKKSSGATRMRADSTGMPWARASSVIAHQQAHGLRGDSLSATGETQLLAGGRLHADRVDIDAEVGGDRLAHRLRMRA